MFFMAFSIRFFLVENSKRAPRVDDKAQVAATTSLIEMIGESLTTLKKECGAYPDSLEELVGEGLCSKACPQVDCLKPEDLKDAWGRPFDYFRDSERLIIRSLGKDGRAGGDEDFTLMLPLKDE